MGKINSSECARYITHSDSTTLWETCSTHTHTHTPSGLERDHIQFSMIFPIFFQSNCAKEVIVWRWASEREATAKKLHAIIYAHCNSIWMAYLICTVFKFIRNKMKESNATHKKWLNSTREDTGNSVEYLMQKQFSTTWTMTNFFWHTHARARARAYTDVERTERKTRANNNNINHIAFIWMGKKYSALVSALTPKRERNRDRDRSKCTNCFSILWSVDFARCYCSRCRVESSCAG